MRILWLLALLTATVPSRAATVAGVAVPPDARPVADGPVLVLNGAGLRTKYFFHIYVAALYLVRRADSAAAVLAEPGPKRVWMHFLYRSLSGARMARAWDEGFRDNLSRAEYAALRPRIERFNALFDTVRRGDVVLLDALPGRGTRVTVRGRVRGVIPGDDFYRALLRIWLGPDPASDDLKAALLGR